MGKSVQVSGGAVKITHDQKVQVVNDLPLPDLLCDSVSASKTKCGFPTFDDSRPAIYLTEMTSLSASYDDGGTPFHRTGSAEIATSETYDPATCEPICTRIGSSQSEEFYNTNGCQTLDCSTDMAQVCGSWTDHRIAKDAHSGTDCTLIFDTHFTNADILSSCGGISIPQSGCCPLSGYPGSCLTTDISVTQSGSTSSGSFSATATLSNEYTTEMLATGTEGALPGYSGCWNCGCDLDTGQGCDCSASYDLSDDESSLAIQNFKYKFMVSDDDDTPSEGTVLKWVERFTPDDDSGPVDNEKSFTFDGSARETGEYECTHPDSNGATTIEDIRWA